MADAFAISLPADVAASRAQLARYVFENQPAWVDTLMGVRDTLVAGFGPKTAKQLAAPSVDTTEKRVAIFKIYESNAQEVFLGEDDSHLNLRISVQLRPATAASAPQLITLIAPFHRQVVQASLSQPKPRREAGLATGCSCLNCNRTRRFVVTLCKRLGNQLAFHQGLVSCRELRVCCLWMLCFQREKSIKRHCYRRSKHR